MSLDWNVLTQSVRPRCRPMHFTQPLVCKANTVAGYP